MKQLHPIKLVFNCKEANHRTRTKMLSEINDSNRKRILTKRQLVPLANCFTIFNYSFKEMAQNDNQTQFNKRAIMTIKKNMEEKKTFRKALLPKLIIKEEKVKVKPVFGKFKPTPVIIQQESIPKYKLSSFYSLTRGGGGKKETKENQDSLLVKTNINDIEGYHCFGVFDGHGQSGSRIANECSYFFANHFTTLSNQNKAPKGKEEEVVAIQTALIANNYLKIKEAFFAAEDYLRTHYIDTSLSGSTANIILVIDDMLLCANAGDSRSIVVTQSNNSIPLSVDSRPEIPEEAKRILEANGRIDRYEGRDTGPFRVWKQNEEYPGLAMSRSIGDEVAKEIGVISEPVISQYSLQQLKPKYIIIATDGIWDCLTNNDVMNIIEPYYALNNPTEAGRALASKAKTTWKAINDGIYDDIAVIVLFFN